MNPSAQETAASSRRLTRLALLALALMAVIWGYNWVVLKTALDYVGPIDFSMLRNLFGAIVLFMVLLARRTHLAIRAWPRVILLGILQTAAFSLLIQLALINGGAGKTSILVYTMPFMVVPMAWLFFGERIRGLQWPALGLAAVGLVLIVEPWNNQAPISSNLLAVAGGFSWALATMVTKWIKRDYRIDPLPLTAWQMLFGTLALCITAWLVPERPIDPAPIFYVTLIYNVVLATGLGWFLWIFALQHLPAGVAGLASLVAPVIGVLGSWLQLGERPGGLELLGMGLIGLALLALSLRGMVGRRATRARG